MYNVVIFGEGLCRLQCVLMVRPLLMVGPRPRFGAVMNEVLKLFPGLH
jgi:hypothetical protein